MNGFAVRLLPYVLSFFSSLCIMVLELTASRLVARHVGGSLVVWTSVIGIILGGICLGNVLGGRLADRVAPRRAIGPLYALGALMTLGIGLYAPCMIMVGLLGMNAKAAFPIMMGSCAFLMPVSSGTFIRKEAYSPRAALALGLGGVPAVLIAALLIKEMDIFYVRWLVVGVVVIAATLMLRSAARNE